MSILFIIFSTVNTLKLYYTIFNIYFKILFLINEQQKIQQQLQLFIQIHNSGRHG
jgi:hypothetical protein